MSGHSPFLIPDIGEEDEHEMVARSILTRGGFGWTLSPYSGCSHACAYCYVRRRQHIIEDAQRRQAIENPEQATSIPKPWGAFVQAKVNAPERLRREIRRIAPGEGVLLASATDAYQPLEAKLGLTRQLLEILLQWDVKVTILTKSSLVVRDIDLFRQFRNLRVGFSLNTLNRRAWQCLEMDSSPPEERLEALEILRQEQISTFVFMSPAMPFVTDFEELVPTLARRTRRVSAETLNLSQGNFQAMTESIHRLMPGREWEFWRAVTTRTWGNEWAKRLPDLCNRSHVRFGGLFRNECSQKKLRKMFPNEPSFGEPSQP